MQFTILQSVYKNDKPEFLDQCLESIKCNSLQPEKIVLVKDGQVSTELDSIITKWCELLPIQVVGYEKASRDDLKKGEYIVTVSPKKTKLIECWVFKRNWRRTPAHYRIIVVEPEKYDEIMKNIYILRAQGRGYRDYLEKLADGVPAR